MYNFKIDGKICGEVFKSHHLLWKHKTNVGHKKNHFEAARKEAEASDEKKANQNAEKNVAKAAAKQKCITSCFAREWEQEDTDEVEEVEDTEHVDDLDEDLSGHMEQDDDDCNANPCKIHEIISKSSQRAEWVQCRVCPKWFHQHCVGVDEQNAASFECTFH